ncbi:HAD family hydrolase [Achromobacter spanius]|uniref:HAD family hydrolase n=1 Tax=Achromobacter spanius TaxID=217203 RepID=UPI00320AB47A
MRPELLPALPSRSAARRIHRYVDQPRRLPVRAPPRLSGQDQQRTDHELDQNDMLKIVAATHSGMSIDDFDAEVRGWAATARHPKTGRRYTSMVFQPMLELLAYLRANGFRTYIVSGGGIDFMRPWTEAVYGIAPEQVIGSSGKTRYVSDQDGVRLEKLPEVDFIDDGPGKPVGIQRHIGRRPIFAAGNSDGDLQMLEWTTSGRPAAMAIIVHHTDADREWAYDRKSSVGKLDKAWDMAAARGWTAVDMKNDWAAIYP